MKKLGEATGKKQTPMRLRAEVRQKLEEVSGKTGINMTAVTEFAILRLACQFEELAGMAAKALERVVAENMHSLPPDVLDEVTAMKMQGAIRRLEGTAKNSHTNSQ